MNASPSLFLDPFGLPLGFPDAPAANVPSARLLSPVFSGVAVAGGFFFARLAAMGSTRKI